MTIEAIDQIEKQIGSLTEKQIAALPLLASGQSYADVAETIGVACGTVRNWCSTYPAFKAELLRLRRDMYVEANERLKALAFAATEALHSVVTDSKIAARDRVAAAKVVLGHVYDKTQTHHIKSSQDAASMIVRVLKDVELSDEA